MSRLADLGQPIPDAKVRGLVAALDARGGRVEFKNGAVVEYERCRTCDGDGALSDVEVNGQQVAAPRECPSCGGEGRRLLVTRPAGGVARYRIGTELHAAYALALRGPLRKPGRQALAEKAERYGEDPPW